MNSSVIASLVLEGTTIGGIGVSVVVGVSTEFSTDFDGVDESEEGAFLQAERSKKMQSKYLIGSPLVKKDCQRNVKKMWNL
jgi:hypothetical protein